MLLQGGQQFKRRASKCWSVQLQLRDDCSKGCKRGWQFSVLSAFIRNDASSRRVEKKKASTSDVCALLAALCFTTHKICFTRFHSSLLNSLFVSFLCVVQSETPSSSSFSPPPPPPTPTTQQPPHQAEGPAGLGGRPKCLSGKPQNLYGR